MNKIKKRRITSIDALRGLVMLLMLNDHTRERVFLHHSISDPMNIDTTDPSLFFTRITAHFCAPIFVFLTGLAAWLYANPSNGEKRDVKNFLLKRGAFLVFLECTFINFSWFGRYETLYLQVMWAIGLSMIALAFASKLPKKILFVLGILIICGHNLLTPITFQPDEFGNSLWTILHDRGYLLHSNLLNIKISYPVLPWIGTIFLGYCCGSIFSSDVSSEKRLTLITKTSIGALALLAVLRGFNIYGETEPWSIQETGVKTIMSIVNFTKYPPSLDFLLFALGVGGLLLVCFEKQEGRITHVLKQFGSAPLFFYILHLYVLLFIYLICISIWGTNKGVYFGVDPIWKLWVISITLGFVLYFPTKYFSQYKKSSKAKWIKYL